MWWYEELGFAAWGEMQVGGGHAVSPAACSPRSYHTVPADNTDLRQMQFAIVRCHPTVVKEIQQQ